MSCSEWEKVKLGDILNFRRGHDLPKTEMEYGQYPVVGSNGIIGYHKKYTTESPCITVGRSGNVGNPYIYYENCWAHNTTLYVDDFKGNHPRFIYYLLKTLNLANYGGGSAVPTLNRNHIHPIELYYPRDFKEQTAIANILSSLDEKIEVNNQINKTLETMAQELFKHWFVDFEFPNKDGEPYKSSGGEMVESELGMVPKGWEVKKLSEVIDFVKVSTKPGLHLSDRKYLPIDTMSMKSVTIKEYKTYYEANSSLILFEKYDILIGAMRVYFHRVNLAPFKGVTRSTTFVLRSKNEYDIAYNLFLLNLNDTINFAEKTSKGTTMPYAIWENGLGELPIIYPNQSLRKKYNNVVFSMLNKMINNAEENYTIQKIHGTILPKLMSGEIRVPIDEGNKI